MATGNDDDDTLTANFPRFKSHCTSTTNQESDARFLTVREYFARSYKFENYNMNFINYMNYINNMNCINNMNFILSVVLHRIHEVFEI